MMTNYRLQITNCKLQVDKWQVDKKHKKIKLIMLFMLLLFCGKIFCSFGKDINEGNKFFYKQQYEKSQEKYNSAEIKNPNSAIVYYNRGNNFYKQQLYEQAIKEYQKALGLTKDKNLKSKILYNMGNAYLKLSDTQKAKESYKQALMNNPDDEDTKYNLQYTLLELQKQSLQNKDKQQNQKDQSQQQKNQEQSEKKEQQKYMSEQDVQRLLEAVNQQQKDKLKEALKPQKPQLPPVDKDW